MSHKKSDSLERKENTLVWSKIVFCMFWKKAPLPPLQTHLNSYSILPQGSLQMFIYFISCSAKINCEIWKNLINLNCFQTPNKFSLKSPLLFPRAEHLEQGRAGWGGVGKMKAVEVARKDIICFRLQDLLRLLSPISCWLDRRSANPADSIPINKNRAISCNGRCIFLNNCKKMQSVNSLKNSIHSKDILDCQ